MLQSFCPPGSGHSVRKVTVYVSDFGKKRMEAEARYGPQGIWKKGLAQEEDEDSENEDLYEGIMGVDEEEDEDEGSEGDEHDGSGHSGSDESSSDESGDSGSDRNSDESAARAAPTSRKALKKGDFVRKNGAVGIVMHTDLKLRGKASRHRAADSEGDSGDSAGSDAEDASSAGGRKGAQQKKLKDGDGYDEIALRKYELSKLRYVERLVVVACLSCVSSLCTVLHADITLPLPNATLHASPTCYTRSWTASKWRHLRWFSTSA